MPRDRHRAGDPARRADRRGARPARWTCSGPTSRSGTSTAPTAAALLPALADADAVLIRSATKIDAEALAAAPKLKVVARAGIGLDNVDVPAATARGVHGRQRAAVEHRQRRRARASRCCSRWPGMIPAADASLRAGEWKRSKFTGVEIADKTVGVVGLGRIGVCSPQRMAAFGVTADRLRPLRAARPGRRSSASGSSTWTSCCARPTSSRSTCRRPRRRWA